MFTSSSVFLMHLSPSSVSLMLTSTVIHTVLYYPHCVHSLLLSLPHLRLPDPPRNAVLQLSEEQQFKLCRERVSFSDHIQSTWRTDSQQFLTLGTFAPQSTNAVIRMVPQLIFWPQMQVHSIPPSPRCQRGKRGDGSLSVGRRDSKASSFLSLMRKAPP